MAGLTIEQRIRGSIFGMACGDALGESIEFVSRERVRTVFGPEGLQYFPDKIGRITDDTQMSVAVIDGFTDARFADKLHPDAFRHDEPDPFLLAQVARRFVDWARAPKGGHRAPGNACLSGTARLARGIAPLQAGAPDAGGCGAIMRAAPYGLMLAGLRADHPDDPFVAAAAAMRTAEAHSRMTHGHPTMGRAPAAALAAAVTLGARGGDVTAMLGAMQGALMMFGGDDEAKVFEDVVARSAPGRIDQQVLAENPAWRGDHALFAAAHVLIAFPDDVVSAIRAAVNIDGDSDSLGAIVGALVGVRTGPAALDVPEWIGRIEFREWLDKAVDDAVLANRVLSE